MPIISVYNCSKLLKNFSQSFNSLSVATILTDLGFSKPTDEKTQKLFQTKPKPKMESLQFPQFTRQELIAYHANKISQAMQARHLQQLKMLCLVPSNGLNK